MPPLPDPQLPDACWPVDTSCCDGFDEYPASVQEDAIAFAGQAMRSLTAYRVGGCPITVRPCLRRCMPSTWVSAPVGLGNGLLNPHVATSGQWVNGCGCATSNCSCVSLCEIRLPPPVGWVVEVTIDGVPLSDAAWRVDNYQLLVRTDGECWPHCQDMSVAADEIGSFAVTYLNAVPVDTFGARAAGVLACEFASWCVGGECRLPPGVTEVVRQGVTMTVVSGVFPGGMTGIPEVDTYVDRWNPYRLKTPPRVYSPDVPRLRRTTFP